MTFEIIFGGSIIILWVGGYIGACVSDKRKKKRAYENHAKWFEPVKEE